MRIMNAILALALPRKGYIPLWNTSPVQNVLTRYLTNNVVSTEQEGIIEHVYRYEIPDVWEIEDKLVNGNVAPLAQITLRQVVGDESLSNTIIID